MELQYALLDAQVKSINAQTAIANLDSLQLMYASPNDRRIKELEMQKAAIEKSKLEKQLKALETINRNQIRRREIQVERRENRLKEAKSRLDELIIRAPHSGLALRAISWLTGKTLQEGDGAWSGMPLVTLPDLTTMKVVIQASEISYKRINVNDPVEITFDAMPDNVAWGKILKKAPIGKPIINDSKVKVFEMEASIDSCSKGLPDPGLTAKCNIVIRRLKDTLVIPQLAIFDQDSMKVVYVKLSKGFEERQILTGATSPKEAVVVAGLSKKERISLKKPISADIRQRLRLPDSVVKKHSATDNQLLPVPDAFINNPNPIHPN
jgi:multidrug efflux pump subunit AcrA (membrane-fusion protein)